MHSTTPRRQASRLRLCICLASWLWSSVTMAAALVRKRYGCRRMCTGVFRECTSAPETLERTSIYGAGEGQELKWKSLFRAISQPRLALALRSDHPSARVAAFTTWPPSKSNSSLRSTGGVWPTGQRQCCFSRAQTPAPRSFTVRVGASIAVCLEEQFGAAASASGKKSCGNDATGLDREAPSADRTILPPLPLAVHCSRWIEPR